MRDPGVRLRSLADDLRVRTDDDLIALLAARPDLLKPTPTDITSLAVAATSGVSVSRILEELGVPESHVLAIAARLCGEAPAGVDEIAAAADFPDADTARSYALHLRTLGLLWGPADGMRAITAIREQAGPLATPVTWPRPEPVVTQTHDATFVDEQAGLAAVEAVAHARETLDACTVDWPAVLRAGGMSIRDFGALAKHLNSSASETAFWVELTAAAGLLAADESEPAAWVPTDSYDTWLARSNAQRWLALVAAWLDMPRMASQRDGKSPILHDDDNRKAIPRIRASALSTIAEAPAGSVVDRDSIITVLADRHPRRGGPLQAAVVDSVLLEGSWLGVLGAGALCEPMRMLLDGASTKEVVSAKATAMPAEIDHVFLQGDLTMIAPGPLVASLAKSLRVLADVESRGHATVYRISPESIRRAIDSGWTAEAITEVFRDASATPLPQSLEYLIGDAARAPTLNEGAKADASHKHHGERRTKSRPRPKAQPKADQATIIAAVQAIRAGEAERQAALGG